LEPGQKFSWGKGLTGPLPILNGTGCPGYISPKGAERGVGPGGPGEKHKGAPWVAGEFLGEKNL